MAIPSIGDILMLSQTAWKIGRAFNAGRARAPAEFHEIELQVNSLAKALKLLAETMFSEEADVWKDAQPGTLDGFATILNSCQQSIEDLDSLTDQYQVIKKTRTTGGFSVERSWSDMVLAQYQTMMWTTEGGNINHLLHLLKMHTHMISLVRQALQSQSLSHLESVVTPMAEQVNGIHHRTGTLSQELDKANRIVQAIANQASHSLPNGPASIMEDMPKENPSSKEPFSAQQFLPQRHSPKSSRSATPPSSRTIKASYSPLMDNGHSASPPRSPSQESALRTQLTSRRTSTACIPSDEDSDSELDDSSSHFGYLTSYHESLNQTSSKRDSASRASYTRPDSCTLSPRLVQPAMPMELPPPLEIEEGMSELDIHPAVRNEISHRHRSSTTASQRLRFEKAAFAHSAILCDVSGVCVEYAQVSDDDRDVEMIEACQNCRICVVRKREAFSDARDDIQLMTSIWALSDDDTVRLELRMADGEMYVPYTSYFSSEKVSLTVPCELKFHDVQYGQRVLRTAKTTWINYIFDSAQAATLFQNELMGRTLLATFRTSQTLRLHEGISGAFSYAEQMCGMENLRIWEDEETLAVIALIHFSPQFRKGYLAFYLNSSNNPIKVKDEGGRLVKVKGLRVPLEKAALRKDSIVAGDIEGKIKGKKSDTFDRKKFVTGARIEFASEVEKRNFIRLVWDVQENMRELPSLSGVN